LAGVREDSVLQKHVCISIRKGNTDLRGVDIEIRHQNHAKRPIRIVEKKWPNHERAQELTKDVLAMVEKEYKIRLTEENSGMFVTHLSIALQRLIDKKPFNIEHPAVLDEVRKHTEEYEFGNEIKEMIEKCLNLKVPETELGFIVAYLCILTGKTQA